MPPIDVKYLKEEEEVRQSETGTQALRTAIVINVVGDTVNQQLEDAVDELPNLGAPHPDWYGYHLQQRNPTFIRNGVVRVRLVYGTSSKHSGSPPPSTSNFIEIGANLSQEETSRDADGDVVTLSYTYPEDYELEEKWQGQTHTVTASMPYMVPETTLRISKRLNSYTIIKNQAKTYVGTTNTAGWAMDPGAVAGSWLCTSVQGVSNDGGQTYTVTYEFQYRRGEAKDTGGYRHWEVRAVFYDEKSGRIPNIADLDADSDKWVDVFKQLNFNNLVS